MNVLEKQRLDLALGSVLLFLLRGPVRLVGRLTRRDHSRAVRGDLLLIKMQGGGSLVLAYTLLLGVRDRYPDRRLLLLTTPSVAPFAETLGIFDEILVVRDESLPALLVSALHAWWRCVGIDTVIDLEVFSRLTTVFSVLTLARNRLGFYLESTFWRRNVHTRLIFLNRFSPIHLFYEAIAAEIDAPVASVADCAARLRARLPHGAARPAGRRITVGHACSEMGRERMLTPAQWRQFCESRRLDGEELVFLGSRADREGADAIIAALAPRFEGVSFVNRCGERSLAESVAEIAASDEFWGVDSGLLHYAWLLDTKTVSFWGPTDPRTRLRATDRLHHEVYYRKVICSPCIHVAETPPCGGNNVCIQGLFGGESDPQALVVSPTIGVGPRPDARDR